MRRFLCSLIVSGLASTVGVIALPHAAAVPGGTRTEPALGIEEPLAGPEAIEALGADLAVVARHNGMAASELTEVLRTDDSARVGTNGSLFFVDAAPEGRRTASIAAPDDVPPDQVFALHSKPGSKHTIFLDFDGATITGTAWNAEIPDLPAVQGAWDPAGDGPAFNATERGYIAAIWSSVAEDYAPFDVDVTTEEPDPEALVRTSSTDDTFGAHALITPGSDPLSTYCYGCGGIARYRVFDQVVGENGAGYGYGYEQPAWIQTDNIINVSDIADIVSHEVGHHLGLLHDGLAWDPSGYYDGARGWVPIMGGGYTQPISQWSKGDYTVAGNREDDVALIKDVVGERPDEAPSGITAAPRLPSGPGYVSHRDDVDTYRLGTCSGPVTVAATGVPATNLDILLTLRSSTGAEIASADPPSSETSAKPATGMDATVTADVPPGAYFVSVDGVGRGTWAGQGYDDYGSLGAYTLEVTGDCVVGSGIDGPANVTATPASLTAVTVRWVAPYDDNLTGFRLTRSGSDEEIVVGADDVSHTWSGLTTDTEYTFQVVALTSAGSSDPVTVTARSASGPPGPVRNISGRWDYTTHYALMTWTAPADTGGAPVTEYAVYQGDELLGTEQLRGHYFYGLAPGTYTYSVAARTVVGEGPRTEFTVTVLPPPTNDDFVSRQALAGAHGSVDGDNTAATAEPGDPAPPTDFGDAGGVSVWYAWTAPATGPVTFTTTRSANQRRDTILAAYTGTEPGNLQLLAGNDDVSVTNPLSTITFGAQEGQTYLIVVDGYRWFTSGSGPFTLSWDGADPALLETRTTLEATALGRSVTLTATVGTDTGTTPTGTVRFTDGTTAVGAAPVVDGVAALALDGLAAGSHIFTATFQPADATIYAASADQRTVAVAATPTSTGLTASSAGRTVTLSATVTAPGEAADGNVEFRDGTQVIGTRPVTGGSATLTLTGVSVGAHTYTATFRPATGDQVGSTSPARQVAVRLRSRTTVKAPATVRLRSTTFAVIRITTEANKAASGKVTVRYGTSTRTVTLFLGLALVPVKGLPLGTHAITATYQGNATTEGSSASTQVLVRK